MNEKFTEFRAVYPRQADETRTFQQWTRCVLSGAKPQDIVEGAKLYRDYCEVAKTESHFIPLPWNWLRDKRWLERLVPKKEKVWLGSPANSRRWTANQADEPKISSPITVKPAELPEPPVGFRSAAEILAEHRAKV